MNTATVANVQRFSVHDGPGIRTTVFLKGCPLRCPWCHNPETLDPRPQVTVRGDRCLACGRCVPVCGPGLAGPVDRPEGAIAAGDGPDDGLGDRPGDGPGAAARCLRCGACADACPSGARERVGRDVTVPGLVAELERDRPYFEASGGGVTFSGGEPAAAHHAPFLLECLDLLGRSGLHRAVDTCGHVPTGTMLAVAERAELILYDLKIMDPGRHREVLGVDNGLILENLRRLAEGGHEILVRLPVVPGFTDSAANLEAAAAFVASLGKPCPVELLPYHGMARGKYAGLGLPDPLAAVPDTPPDALRAAAAPFAARGLAVVSGG